MLDCVLGGAHTNCHVCPHIMSRRKDVPKDSSNDSSAALHAAQLKVEQMLALLDMSGTSAPSQYRGVNGGLMYALQDLLSPLRTAAPETAVNKIATLLGFPGPSEEHTGIASYTAAANAALQMVDRLSQLAKEELPGESKSALTIAQERADKLSRNDQNDIVLRMRKKRHICSSGERKRTSNAPRELCFKPHGEWVDTVENDSVSMSPKDTAAALVSAFSAAMRKQAEIERNFIQGTRNRVRAWIAAWDNGGEIRVEVRDTALVAIGVDESSDVRITRVNVLAPTESAKLGAGTSHAFLPSRYAYYRELSDHLLVHALRREETWVRSLAQTLLHCAGLSTLYDPVPDTCSGRVATATLDPRQLIDRATCVVWKWCHVPGADTVPAAWHAFAPSMIP